MIVKVCGLTNAADAVFAASEGADLLGFVVHPPSPRHCPDLAGASRDVRDRAVLVTVADDAETILRVASAAGIRKIQPYVSADYRDKIIQRLKMEGYFIIYPWIDGIDGNEDQDQKAVPAELYIWESNPNKTGVLGGSGQAHGMAFPPPGPFLLAGGLDGNNLNGRAALCPADARVHFQGFDAASRLERAPGIKDPLKVRAFIQTAKSIAAEVLHARD
ncbi:MAG: hypothetical protein IPP78_13235 [Holophagaceae bacterium]|nr:hypothetical protein [Holophagaceae bacterium]